jgi:flagellar M-ring protein FliF
MQSPLTAVLPAPDAAGRPDARRGALARLALLPLRAKLMLGLGTAGLVAVAVALLLWGQQGNYALLFGSLTEKDAGSVTTQLEQMGVPYRLSAAGSILVPADQVLGLRMKLAQLNLPHGSSTGNELLDVNQFGQSPIKERSMLTRALQGELERSIATLDAVQAARVHLSIPATTAFFQDRPKPSASVVLTLQAGRTLERGQVAGIVFLVVRAVAGMSPRDVAVVDQSGNLLSESGDNAGLDREQLQYVRQVEAGLAKRVVDILEPTVGRDNLRASVTAEVDFNQLETTSEQFKPNQNPADATVRSTRSTESGSAGALQPTGVPGAASNQPGAAAAIALPGASAPTLQPAQLGGSAGGLRRESQTNYEVDRTVAVRRNAVGALRRVSAAVLVNYRSAADAKGKTTAQPLPADEIEKISALVQQAIGFDQSRGDSVKVVNLPFRTEPKPAPEELPPWQSPWLLDLVRAGAVPFALLAVATMLVFAVMRPALRRTELPAPAAPAPALDDVVDDRADQVARVEAPALEMTPAELQLDHARALAKQNPAAVAGILRGWVGGSST